ncbi:hypothetical protein [Kordia sp.]|uniref:hypothetical protein n=1 Tax=Kordia sp. TaxID=1965332 RepID=UPI003B5C42B9
MYLIWALINAAFVILFFALVLTLFAKGKQLFNNKYGNGIIVVFVLGVIGLLGAKESDFSNEYIKGYPVERMHTTIEDNILFDIHLSVSLKKDDLGTSIPCYSRSDASGFISGHVWEFKHADIDALETGKYSYSVRGLLHWHLFGIKVYSQNKIFEGIIE